jgi:hypothetical protein
MKTVGPVMREVRELTEKQYLWRLRLIIVGVLVGIAVSSGVAWVTQPSSKQLLDAARWRHWQEGFTPEQADRINGLLKEIEKEDDAKKGKGGDSGR